MNTILFHGISPTERDRLFALATTQHLKAGDVLYYEGDPTDRLYLLAEGHCRLTWGTEPRGDAYSGDWLDLTASLGGLPHRVKATAFADCNLLMWSASVLWESPEFAAVARRWLAEQLESTRLALAEVRAPVHYRPDSAELMAGPFAFEQATVIFAFCELAEATIPLPDGLTVLNRPDKRSSPLLLALAQFPNAYPEHTPTARFTYSETTYFIPVRHGMGWGLYTPYIYPSTWEPILLGREIYGFPKTLGQTHFESHAAKLVVEDKPYLDLTWQHSGATEEAQLVGALGAWLGFTGRLTAAMFQAGEVLRKMTRLPAHRRVEIYNHKRIPAADTEHDSPRYAVNQLTRAVFGVLRWYQIAALQNPALQISGGPFADCGLTLREAYRAQLDLRLSTARIERDYQPTKETR